jgi:hypothetical protein
MSAHAGSTGRASNRNPALPGRSETPFAVAWMDSYLAVVHTHAAGWTFAESKGHHYAIDPGPAGADADDHGTQQRERNHEDAGKNQGHLNSRQVQESPTGQALPCFYALAAPISRERSGLRSARLT